MSYLEHYYSSREGLRLYFRSYGTGSETVLCLPGLTRNCKDFEDLAEHLGSQWKVITPDLRGRGRSGWDPKPQRYNPTTYAEDAWQLLDELGAARVSVIGTSLGGLVAMVMADQQPQRLSGIVLNDIGPELPAAAVARVLQYAGRAPELGDWNEAAAYARQVHELAYPGMPENFWRDYARRSYTADSRGRLVPDMDPAIGDVLRRPPLAHRCIRWLSRHGLVRRLRGAAIDPWQSFRSMTMPCLVLHGVLSEFLTHDIVLRMQREKPDLDVVTVPERGHVPLLDEPLARSAIDRFLQGISGK